MSSIGEKNQEFSDLAAHPITKEVWLCLRFTHLALNSAGYLNSTEHATAITQQQQIWQCAESATQLAIKPGMTVNHALMLCPNIHLQERVPQEENAKLQKLSHWAYRFTSIVSVYNDHALLLEIGKSSKLFNGLKHLINVISSELLSFGFTASLGLANTPKAIAVPQLK